MSDADSYFSMTTVTHSRSFTNPRLDALKMSSPHLSRSRSSTNHESDDITSVASHSEPRISGSGSDCEITFSGAPMIGADGLGGSAQSVASALSTTSSDTSETRVISITSSQHASNASMDIIGPLKLAEVPQNPHHRHRSGSHGRPQPRKARIVIDN
jgi:hypothetical protein